MKKKPKKETSVSSTKNCSSLRTKQSWQTLLGANTPHVAKQSRIVSVGSPETQRSILLARNFHNAHFSTKSKGTVSIVVLLVCKRMR